MKGKTVMQYEKTDVLFEISDISSFPKLNEPENEHDISTLINLF